MFNHLAPSDAILWIMILVITTIIIKVNKGKFITITLAMLYIVIESVVELVSLFGNQFTYRQIYYLLSTGECLILSICAIQISGNLIDKLKEKIFRWGPVVIAIPTFCAYNIFSTNIGQELLLANKLIRLSELAFIFSVALLLACIGFEEDESEVKSLARSYAVLLVLLVLCTELQVKFGLIDIIRKLWMVCWLVGLSGVAYSCRSIGNKTLAITNGGVE